MARRAWWPTVETSEAIIFARGNVTAAACAEAGSDCCDADPAGGGSPCCPDGFAAALAFAAEGPLAAEFGAVVLDGDLNRAAERGTWIGGAEGEAALALEIACVEDSEFGTLWTVAGSYFAVALGATIPFVVFATVADDLLTAEIEVPGTGTPLTVVIVHPCPTGSGSGSGSGGSGSGSGSGSGGGAGCCGMTAPSLCATFGGSLTGLGAVQMSYNATPDSYSGSSLACGNRTAGLTCIDGQYEFSVSSTDPWELTVVSCSPLIITGTTPNSAAPCPGAATVIITEGPCP